MSGVRACNISWRSIATVSDLPGAVGDFTLTVMSSDLLPNIPADRKKPVPGIGDEAFYYVNNHYARVGELALNLFNLGQTSDPGLEPDAPRLALLRLAAGRLR